MSARQQLTRLRAFNFGEFLNGKAQQPLPSSLTSDEARISGFADLCHDLCQKLLYLLGIGLGVGIHPRNESPLGSNVV